MRNMKRITVSVLSSLALAIALIPAGAAVYAADKTDGDGLAALAQQIQDPSNDPFD